MANKKSKRIVDAVKRQQEFWNTYPQQKGYENYQDDTFVDDAVYAIGIALDPKKYSYFDGYEKFKREVLIPMLDEK